MLKRLLSRWFGRTASRCSVCAASDDAIAREREAVADRLEIISDKLMELVDQLRGEL